MSYNTYDHAAGTSQVTTTISSNERDTARRPKNSAQSSWPSPAIADQRPDPADRLVDHAVVCLTGSEKVNSRPGARCARNTAISTTPSARLLPSSSSSLSSPPFALPSLGCRRLGFIASSFLHASTALPPFPTIDMSLRIVPTTPRVISPSPTPSDGNQRGQSQDPEDSYLGPVTRSVSRRGGGGGNTPQQDDRRRSSATRESRTRSRSPVTLAMATVRERLEIAPDTPSLPEANGNKTAAATATGRLYLAPPSTTPGYWTWRDFSRSPSPIGLIPIHRHWRSFVHRHEVPRKALHVSIGFFALWLYAAGTQPDAVTPWLMTALIPIATADLLRFNWPSFNRLYVRLLGALMRETEFSGFNGVIFYLIGAWVVLSYCPKDVSMTAVLLLSWCDTAASTFGRLFGRYTPRLRRGKSLAGSLAAFSVGIATASMFWGWVVPATEARFPGSDDVAPLMFRGVLRLPSAVAGYLGIAQETATIAGGVALVVMSVWSGFVAAASEAVDIFGLDDNLTIPVLSGIGILGFLKLFG